MRDKHRQCPRCATKARLKDRDFSAQAVAALLAWGEIEKEHVGKAICEDCYGELREVLMDRADELAPVPVSGVSELPSEITQAG